MAKTDELMEFMSLVLMRYELEGSGDRVTWLLKQLYINETEGE